MDRADDELIAKTSELTSIRERTSLVHMGLAEMAHLLDTGRQIFSHRSHIMAIAREAFQPG